MHWFEESDAMASPHGHGPLPMTMVDPRSNSSGDFTADLSLQNPALVRQSRHISWSEQNDISQQPQLSQSDTAVNTQNYSTIFASHDKSAEEALSESHTDCSVPLNSELASHSSSAEPSLQSTPQTTCQDCPTCTPAPRMSVATDICCHPAMFSVNRPATQYDGSLVMPYLYTDPTAAASHNCGQCIPAFQVSASDKDNTLAANVVVPCNDEACLNLGTSDVHSRGQLVQAQPCSEASCESVQDPHQGLAQKQGSSAVICQDGYCESGAPLEVAGPDCSGVQTTSANGQCVSICDGVVNDPLCVDKDCGANCQQMCSEQSCTQLPTHVNMDGIAETSKEVGQANICTQADFAMILRACCPSTATSNGGFNLDPSVFQQLCAAPNCGPQLQEQQHQHCSIPHSAPLTQMRQQQEANDSVARRYGFEPFPWVQQDLRHAAHSNTYQYDGRTIDVHGASLQQSSHYCHDKSCEMGYAHCAPPTPVPVASATPYSASPASTPHSSRSSDGRKLKRKFSEESSQSKQPELTPEQLEWLERKRAMSKSSSSSLASQDQNTEPTIHACRWDTCTEVFNSTADLQAHVLDVHVGTKKGRYECLWQNCTHKTRLFDQKQKIARHVQSHTKDRPFQCDICLKHFSEKSTLKQHQRSHTGEKPKICHLCGHGFSTQSCLTIHIRTHTGDKPFVCDYPGCDRRFVETSNLSKHKRIHTGDRPFACTFPGCSKAFSRPDQQTRHEDTHRPKDERRKRAKTSVSEDASSWSQAQTPLTSDPITGQPLLPDFVACSNSDPMTGQPTLPDFVAPSVLMPSSTSRPP